MSDTNKNGPTVYLIVPTDRGDDHTTMPDASLEDQGITDGKKIFRRGRKEMSVDAEKVEKQISDYASVVHNIASNSAEDKGGLILDEIKLSLTISASGNIGIASTSAEAGIELIFKRK